VDERGVVYGEGTDDAFRVSSLDVPVVKVGAGNASLEPDAPPLQALNPSPLPIASLPRLAQGFAFNIHNNIWGTNAIQCKRYLLDSCLWSR